MKTKTDPRPGDVLREWLLMLAVTMVEQSIHYELTDQRAIGGVYAAPMACQLSKPKWREWARKAEVITVAAEGGDQ